jgi:hypothetical protein
MRDSGRESASDPALLARIGSVHRRAPARLAPQPQRIELFHHPLDAVLAPEWLAIDDEGRNSEDAVAVRPGKTCVEVGARLGFGVVNEGGGVEADFGQQRPDCVAILDVELLAPEALEYTLRVLVEFAVAFGEQPALRRSASGLSRSP